MSQRRLQGASAPATPQSLGPQPEGGGTRSRHCDAAYRRGDRAISSCFRVEPPRSCDALVSLGGVLARISARIGARARARERGLRPQDGRVVVRVPDADAALGPRRRRCGREDLRHGRAPPRRTRAAPRAQCPAAGVGHQRNATRACLASRPWLKRSPRSGLHFLVPSAFVRSSPPCRRRHAAVSHSETIASSMLWLAHARMGDGACMPHLHLRNHIARPRPCLRVLEAVNTEKEEELQRCPAVAMRLSTRRQFVLAARLPSGFFS